MSSWSSALSNAVGAGDPHKPGVDGGTVLYHSYTERWYLLAAFSLLSFLQSFIWITYDPIATSAKVRPSVQLLAPRCHAILLFCYW